MIELVSNEKIAETSSKGNQEKWLDEGRWYKLDQFGYEGLAEVFTSRILQKSNIADLGFDFVKYRPERILVHGIERTGCSSEDFLKKGETLVTLANLYRKHLGCSLSEHLGSLSGNKNRMRYIAEETAELTGLEDFPKYLTLLFEIDGLFLNDDRHLNNIAVIARGESFDYCPVFDQGAGLLSNTSSMPLNIEPRGLISVTRARPFVTTFNRQIRTMQGLYGPQLSMPKLSRQELAGILEPLLEFYPQRDRGLIADRVVQTVLTRQKELK